MDETKVVTEAIEARFIASISEIPAAQWNQLAGIDYPFLRHEYLLLLETSGCTDRESGWVPLHLTLFRGEQLIALMPLYLKSHSYGEYVFDWSWADAWHRNGRDYYPKLVTAVPFTPATGPRLCLAEGESAAEIYPLLLQAVKQMAEQQEASSWHVLFPDEEAAQVLEASGMALRTGSQFHWFNQGYTNFDEFLGTFNSRKRKSLRRERRAVAEQDIELRTLTGAEISSADWEKFHFFYQMTYAKRSGHGGYLNKEFFLGLGDAIGEHCVMVLAYQHQQPVAGALYFRSSNTLFGRYWGCEQELDCLHFEACYYQGIDYCIAQGLQRFDPGAQGEHKIQRGFTPIKTWSNHWIADPGFAAAIADFTRREQEHTEQYIDQAATFLPFKQTE
ncbi:GNAT family N-acetyltransferase [Candidatus Litorirhabdus singularis]|uniref:GNAT family N-acetyltransferase n=1 Tax=Candidatus Litorirhabdus singularis TaxID=2518993 RepID=UPI0024326AA8|nr:GNAT family N-acetyltransferase [Candidatus Litorirhabdus singularis]